MKLWWNFFVTKTASKKTKERLADSGERNEIKHSSSSSLSSDLCTDSSHARHSLQIHSILMIASVFGVVTLYQLGYQIELIEAGVFGGSSLKNQLVVVSSKGNIKATHTDLARHRNSFSRAETKWQPVLASNKQQFNGTKIAHLFDNDDGENCIVGYRLANVNSNTSSLHCGSGKFSPLSPENDSCGGIPMEARHCVLIVRGEWDAPSAKSSESMIENLQSIPRKYGLHRINPNPNTGDDKSASSLLPRCQTVSDYLNGSLQGPTFDREWVPNECSSVPLDPYYWTSHLSPLSNSDNGSQISDKCTLTITMMGDSHIRNIFTATVQGLRGNHYFVDGHPEGWNVKKLGIIKSYEWKMFDDGSAEDKVRVFLKFKEKDVWPWSNESCNFDFDEKVSHDEQHGGKTVQRVLRLAFIWAPTFSEQEQNLKRVTDWNTDLLVVSPGNWYEPNTTLSSNWTNAIDAVLEQHETIGLGVVHWVGGNQPNDRIEAIDHWVGGHRFHTSQKLSQNELFQRKSYWLQNDFNTNTKQSARAQHFACGLRRKRLINDVIEAVEPCTDETDTAQIRALMTTHFGAIL